VGGLAVLGGCAGKSGAQASTPGKSAAVSSPTAQVTPSSVDDPFGAFPSGGSDGGAPVGALVATKEVPVGGGVLAQGSTIVVQPKAGTFKAFNATCPHQGVTVNPPATGADVMECPGHNSEFKAADGSLVRGPATRGLIAVPVKVRNGYVVTA
jgi:nitrite reductase/ring-hydroxylating ferredoxin subunit